MAKYSSGKHRCCLPTLNATKLSEDLHATLRHRDGVNAYNCQYYKTLNVDQNLLNDGFINLPEQSSLTNGYQKCFDCYRNFAKKYAALYPRLQNVLYTTRHEQNPHIGANLLRSAMDYVEKEEPPDFNEQCSRFHDWYKSLDRDFPEHSIFDGIESTPIVLLKDAVMAIWENPDVWEDLKRKPPNLEPNPNARKAEYKCGLLKGVELAEQRARDILNGNPEDEHGLGINDIAAIHLYTQSKEDGTHCCLYKYLNAALRNTADCSDERKVAHVKPYFKYIRLLQHALLKLPPASGSEILFRGERNYETNEKQRLLRLKKGGKKFPLWAFSSCTDDAQAAEGYFKTEEATLWTKDGPSQLIKIPFQGARILYAIDGI